MDAYIARLLLSLWTSTRRVERVPVVTVVMPTERSQIVTTHEVARAGDWL